MYVYQCLTMFIICLCVLLSILNMRIIGWFVFVVVSLQIITVSVRRQLHVNNGCYKVFMCFVYISACLFLSTEKCLYYVFSISIKQCFYMCVNGIACWTNVWYIVLVCCCHTNVLDLCALICYICVFEQCLLDCHAVVVLFSSRFFNACDYINYVCVYINVFYNLVYVFVIICFTLITCVLLPCCSQLILFKGMCVAVSPKSWKNKCV